MTILDGKGLSLKIREELKARIETMRPQIPLLVIFVCAPNEAMRVYVRQKKNFGTYIGARVLQIDIPNDFSQEQCALLVHWIGECESVHGIIVQLPLPPHIDADFVLDHIPYGKDVDTLSSARLGKVVKGGSNILPPIVAGVRALFEEYEITLAGKEIAIIGTGKLVGRPFEVWLLNVWLGSLAIPARISILNDACDDVSQETRFADIIISGAGVPGLVREIKLGSVLVDCGTSKRNERYLGDIDSSCYARAGFYTPVPGGVGPLTVAFLFRNLVTLFQEQSALRAS